MKLGGCVYMQALVRVNEVNDDVMQYVEDARTGNMRLFGCRRSPSLSSRAVIEKSCLETDRALTQNNISYPAGWLTAQTAVRKYTPKHMTIKRYLLIAAFRCNVNRLHDRGEVLATPPGDE